MKEKVLMCKYTGELFLLTNKVHDDGETFQFVFLLSMFDGEPFCALDWSDDMFEDLGDL